MCERERQRIGCLGMEVACMHLMHMVYVVGIVYLLIPSFKCQKEEAMW